MDILSHKCGFKLSHEACYPKIMNQRGNHMKLSEYDHIDKNDTLYNQTVAEVSNLTVN